MKATKLIINWEEQAIAWWDSMPWVAVLEYRGTGSDAQTKLAGSVYNWYLRSWTLEDGTILVLYNDDYGEDVKVNGPILDISGQSVISISSVTPWYYVGIDDVATWLLRNIRWGWVIFPRQGAWSQGK